MRRIQEVIKTGEELPVGQPQKLKTHEKPVLALTSDLHSEHIGSLKRQLQGYKHQINAFMAGPKPRHTPTKPQQSPALAKHKPAPIQSSQLAGAPLLKKKPEKSEAVGLQNRLTSLSSQVKQNGDLIKSLMQRIKGIKPRKPRQKRARVSGLAQIQAPNAGVASSTRSTLQHESSSRRNLIAEEAMKAQTELAKFHEEKKARPVVTLMGLQKQLQSMNRQADHMVRHVKRFRETSNLKAEASTTEMLLELPDGKKLHPVGIKHFVPKWFPHVKPHPRIRSPVPKKSKPVQPSLATWLKKHEVSDPKEHALMRKLTKKNPRNARIEKIVSGYTKDTKRSHGKHFFWKWKD
jgi:hypothetical protein